MQLKSPTPTVVWRLAAKISISYALVASIWIYASDVLLAQLTGYPYSLAILQAYKGWLFVVATALLLYGLIGYVLTTERLSPLTTVRSNGIRTESATAPPSLWQGMRTPVLIFVLLAGAIGLMGYLVYAHQKKILQTRAEIELLAIADYKVEEIQHWLTERRNDAEFIAQDPFFTQAVRQWLNTPKPSPEDSQRLMAWLTHLKETFHYAAVVLLDAGGQVRSGVGTSQIHPQRRALARHAMASSQVIMTDLHWRQEIVGGRIDMDLIIPLGRGAANEDQPIGALVLKIDPKQYLFPLLQTWPAPSASAEALLVRREGEAVVFLNGLRHRQETALRLRLPVQNSQLPSALAVQGQTGIVAGMDYRQTQVLAAVQPIPETQWFLIAKIDAQEVYTPLRKLMQLVAIVVGIFITGAGMGTALWWRRQHAGFLADRQQQERERQTLAQRFDYLTQHANDIILLLNGQGQLREANDRAVTAYGYSYEELLRLHIRDLRAPETRALIAEQMAQAARPDGQVFETVHQRKDGTRFAVEVSSRRIDLDGKPFLQSIIRDISDRKQTEEMLNFYRFLIDSIRDPVYVISPAQGFRLVQVNKAACEHYGWTQEKLLTTSIPDWNPHFTLAVCREFWDQLKAKQFLVFETTHRVKGGRLIPVEVSANYLVYEHVEYITGFFHDITERKQMEKALRDSEAHLRLALDSGRMGTWLWELATNRVTWDARQCELLGLEPTPGSVSLERFFTLIHPEDRERMRQAVTALLQGSDRWDEEFRIVFPNGLVHWLAGRGELKRNAAGQPLRVIGVDFDITERKQAEQTLARERELLQRILDNIPVMIVMYPPSLQDFRLNAECERVLGWSTATARQVDWLAECYPEPAYRTTVAQALRACQPGWRDLQVTARDGSVVDSLWATIRLSDETLVGIGIDIRARRRAEEALRQAHAWVTGILESITDGFVSLDREWRYTYVNPTAARLLRQSPQALLGQPLWEVCPAMRGSVFERKFRRAVARQQLVTFEGYYAPLRVWYECHCYPAPDGLSIFFTDTSERKRAEQALQESEARLRALVNAVPDVLLVLDEAGRYLEILTAEPHRLYTDPARLRGKGVDEVLPAAIARQVLAGIDQTLRTRRPQTLNYELPIANLGKRWYEVRMAPLEVPLMGKQAVAVLARDVTQRRLTEDNLRQAQKMEAVGQLTGGVAHDFNNLLAIILGNLELLAEQLHAHPNAQELLRPSLAAAERGAALVQRLLAFARRQPLRASVVELNALVVNMMELLQRTLGETIRVQRRLTEASLYTVIDASQFETALLNLALNARDAMPNGGTLTLETAGVWLEAAYTDLHPALKPGQYVRLTVRDTGVGMDPAVLEHALEPFFTTKAVGKGSGLGLSMVYGLVTQSGGHLQLDSEPGHGTTITLYLPPAPSTTEAPGAAPPQDVPASQHLTATILVVEDDPSVRQLAVRLLQSLGYATVAAEDADTGLHVLENTPAVALLFSDVVLPGGRDGVALAREARRRRPALKVLLTSGYTEQNLLPRNSSEEGFAFLSKPYHRAQLASRLQTLLGNGAQHEA